MWIKDQTATFILYWKTCLYVVGNLCSLCFFLIFAIVDNRWVINLQSFTRKLRQAQNIPTPLKISSQYPVFPHVQLRISHPRKTSLEYPSLLRLAQNASLFFRTVLEYSYPSKLTQRTASFLTTCSDYSFTTQN